MNSFTRSAWRMWILVAAIVLALAVGQVRDLPAASASAPGEKQNQSQASGAAKKKSAKKKSKSKSKTKKKSKKKSKKKKSKKKGGKKPKKPEQATKNFAVTASGEYFSDLEVHNAAYTQNVRTTWNWHVAGTVPITRSGTADGEDKLSVGNARLAGKLDDFSHLSASSFDVQSIDRNTRLWDGSMVHCTRRYAERLAFPPDMAGGAYGNKPSNLKVGVSGVHAEIEREQAYTDNLNCFPPSPIPNAREGRLFDSLELNMSRIIGGPSFQGCTTSGSFEGGWTRDCRARMNWPGGKVESWTLTMRFSALPN